VKSLVFHAGGRGRRGGGGTRSANSRKQAQKQNAAISGAASTDHGDAMSTTSESLTRIEELDDVAHQRAVSKGDGEAKVRLRCGCFVLDDC